MIAEIRSSLVGKWRKNVPTATPARRAISRVEALIPSSASAWAPTRKQFLAVSSRVCALLGGVHPPPLWRVGCEKS